MPSVAASSMSTFDNSVGINTHDDLIGSAYQNVAAVENALAYVGLSNVRDTYDFLNDPAEFAQIAHDTGVRYDFYMALGTAGIPWQLTQIEADPSIVSYVEGFNESDNWWQSYAGQTGIAATQAAQQAVYEAIKADPQLSKVGVIQASFGQLATFSNYGNMSAYADYANTHSYFGTGNNPDGGNWANHLVALADSVTPGKPTITTETGYFTMPGSANGVSQAVQAKYLLDLLFEQAKAGVSLTYLYELADNFADPGNTNSEDHFGLFNADWTPKLAAIALHNLMAITADPGTGGVAPGALDYTLSGMPASAMSSLYEKSDGTFVLALWNDTRLSGPTTQADIAVAPTNVTLTLTQPYSTISIYDPLLGTTAIQTFTNAQTVTIAVPDHPVIVEIGAGAGRATTLPVIAAPAKLISMPGDPVQITGLAVNDGSASTVTVTLTAAAGTLAAETTAGHVLAAGVKQLTLSGTLATVNAELATVTYTAGAATGTDIVAVQVVDGTGHPAAQSIGVTVTPPVATTVSGGALLSVPGAFALAAGSTAGFPNVVLSDLYAASHASTVTLTATAPAGTLLVSAQGAAVAGNGTGSLTLSGSFAQVSAALASLAYTAQATPGATTLTFKVADSVGRVSTQTIAVTATALPTLTLPGAITAGSGTATAVTGIALTDSYAIANADSASVTVSDSHGLLSMTDANGVAVAGSGSTSITLSGTVEQVGAELATLRYVSTQAGTETITIAATDLYGGRTSGAISVKTGTPLPPTVTLGTASRVLAGASTALQGLAVGDAASGAASGSAVSVTIASALGRLRANTTAANVVGNGTGTLTLSGTVAQVNAALGSLLYAAGANAGADMLAIKVTDSFGGAASSLLPVTLYAAPTASAPSAVVAKAGLATALAGFSVADSYATQQAGQVSVTLSSQWGTLALGSQLGVTVQGAGTNALSLAGNLAKVNAALATLLYTGGPAATSDTVLLTETDALGGAATASTTLATAAPTATVPSGLLVAPRASQALGGITVSDSYAASRGGQLIVNISDIKAMGGTLRVVDTSGAVQSGSGAYALRLTGTLAQINTSLATLSYTAGATPGIDQVQVNVWDPAGVSRTPLIDIGVGNRVASIAPGLALQQVSGFTTTNGTVLDLRQVMASTGWDGQTGTLSHYLSVRASAGGSILSVMPGGNAAAARDVAQLPGASVSLSDVQLHAWLAPDASTATVGVTLTDTGAGTATVSGSASGVAAVVAADPHTALSSTMADPGTNSVALLGWNNVLDAGAGMNFLNGTRPGDVFRVNGVGQGMDTISGFSLSNGDVLDLTRALAGLNVASNGANLGSFVSTSTSNGNTTVFVDPSGGGSHYYAVATLTGLSTDTPTLASHHALTL